MAPMDVSSSPAPDPAGRAAAAEALRGAATVAAAGHLPLDGDGLGSALGLVHALRAAGRPAVAVIGGGVPRNLRFLPGLGDAVRLPDALPFAPDAFVALDGGSLDRFTPLLPLAETARHLVNVDHHVTNTRFGTASWVDPGYAATGLMVLDLIDDLGLPLTPEAALCLYTALVTDTGRFSFANTSPAAHEAAARLLRAGVRPEEVLRRVYRSLPRGRIALTAEVARRLRVTAGGRVAWSEVTLDMCRDAGVVPLDAHDAVEVPLSLEVVEVAILFRQEVDGTHVSLRSTGALDVAQFAAARGGGGHPRAAGFPVAGPPSGCAERVVADVVAAFAAAEARR
jgi:bifunctional oligoribonuclease and PAP phosphatase NrnA